MAEQAITQGFVEAVFADKDRAAATFPLPVLQCLHVKHIEGKGGNGSDRYRIVLSDIRHFVQCMLGTQANPIIRDTGLQRGSIVRLRQYTASNYKGKNILVILDLDVLSALGAPEKIGDPKPIDPSDKQSATTMGGQSFYGIKNEPEETKMPVARQPVSRPPAAFGGGGGGAPVTIYPIEAVSPFANKWTIKARVTSKSDIRRWHKPSGEGKLFSFNLLDETGEIRATAFNNEVDKFYDLIQEGQVYYISTPCRVSMAKKQFNNLPNDYEITLESGTVIEKAEDQSSVPQVRYNFCNLQDLQAVEKDATVDVIGILKEASAAEEFQSKTTGKPYSKRELKLVDDTGYSVRVTVWGRTATEFDAAPESVLALKGTRVSDFGGRSLSLLSSGTMAVDPDIPEAHKLKGWYEAGGRNMNFATHNSTSLGTATGRNDSVKTVRQVNDEMVGVNNPEYFTLKGTILRIRQDSYSYPACPAEGCNKKVTDMGDGTWRCEKCDASYPNAQHRYILAISVTDHTGTIPVTCFDDTARVILGHSANEIKEMQERGDESHLAVFGAAMFTKWVFRCRAKLETYNDEPKIRYQVMSVTPFDWVSEANKLAEAIKQMSV